MENIPLTIHRTPGQRDGQVVIVLKGPLTISTLSDFQAVVRAEKSPVVILDIAGVTYVDSSGLGSIINAHVSCVKSARRLALAAVPSRVMTLLQVAHVDHVLTIFPAAKEALKAL